MAIELTRQRERERPFTVHLALDKFISVEWYSIEGSARIKYKITRRYSLRESDDG